MAPDAAGTRPRKDVDGILLVYHHGLRPNAATIMEHVEAFERHSRFAVWKVNTELGFPRRLSEYRFSVIALHYSLWWPVRYRLDARFQDYIRESDKSYKIAFYQDEYHYCRKRFAFINDYGIDCIYTLLEPEHVKDVYGKYTPAVRHVVSHIPGYVSEDMVSQARRFARPMEERTIDVGYRGRELHGYMGRGAQEKTWIAREFIERVAKLPLRTDIATSEGRRLYGDAWPAFVGNCKALLGVEAGVSIFDVEDAVLTGYTRLVEENPDISFEEIEERLLSPWENNIYYRTVSPRHFEAAAFRTLQILYEGRYSGVLSPMRHYIPLEKDFSNFDKVMEMFRDRSLVREITDNAWRDLIASGEYGYDRFIAGFDREMAGRNLSPGIDRRLAAEVTAALGEDYRERYARARARSLLAIPFPGRKYLVRWVKSALGIKW